MSKMVFPGRESSGEQQRTFRGSLESGEGELYAREGEIVFPAYSPKIDRSEDRTLLTLTAHARTTRTKRERMRTETKSSRCNFAECDDFLTFPRSSRPPTARSSSS